MKKLSLSLILVSSPALAAGDRFFSLANTDFVVLLAFILFVGVLIYYKVPSILGGMLDKRAEGIQSDINEARALREEAQSLLASYERKAKEASEQVGRVVEAAKKDAEVAAEQAKLDLQASIARRLQAAEDQIASAESKAVKEVRDTAATVAVAAAGDVLAAQMTPEHAGALIDSAIEEVGAKLHS